MNLRLPRAPRAGLLALLGAGALSACAPILVGGVMVGTAMVATDRRTTATQLEDNEIDVKAANRIQDVMGDKGEAGATSYNRVVLLTGEVPQASDKANLEQAIAHVENVQSVVNELSVGGFARSLSQRSNDSYTTTKVKTSLVDAKDLFSNSIKIVTYNGAVYLMGRVTEREADRAAEVARGVGGVTKVVKVFQIISEQELANTAPKAPASQ
jgi:osmotically-inducible protein OsmY